MGWKLEVALRLDILIHPHVLRMDLRKKSKAELMQLFEKHGFPKKTGPSDDGSGYWYLLSKEVEALLASKQAAIKKLESIKVGDLERS